MGLSSFLRSLLGIFCSSRKAVHHRKQTKQPKTNTRHPRHRHHQEQRAPRDTRRNHRPRERDHRESHGHRRAQGDSWPAPPRQRAHRPARPESQGYQLIKGDKWPEPMPHSRREQAGRGAERPPPWPDRRTYRRRTGLQDCPASTVGVVEATDRAMSREEVREVGEIMAARFSHIPFAISGQAAMTCYGYGEKPFQVNIVCSDRSRKPLACWARAQGIIAIPHKQDTWGVETSDGSIRQVRVSFLDDFEHVHLARLQGSSAAILSLAGVADEIARAYVDELEDADYADQERQDGLGRELRWVLERIVSLPTHDQELKPERAPHLVQKKFWVPFTLSYPEMVPLFKAAGWPVPNDRW